MVPRLCGQTAGISLSHCAVRESCGRLLRAHWASIQAKVVGTVAFIRTKCEGGRRIVGERTPTSSNGSFR